MLLYKAASFFCPGWPIYTGLALKQFPDLKNVTEQTTSSPGRFSLALGVDEVDWTN